MISDNGIFRFVQSAAKVAANPSIAKDDEYMSRLEICGTCSEYKDCKCSQCGCFMPFKARFQVSICPLNKW